MRRIGRRLFDALDAVAFAVEGRVSIWRTGRPPQVRSKPRTGRGWIAATALGLLAMTAAVVTPLLSEEAPSRAAPRSVAKRVEHAQARPAARTRRGHRSRRPKPHHRPRQALVQHRAAVTPQPVARSVPAHRTPVAAPAPAPAPAAPSPPPAPRPARDTVTFESSG
jgi:hypothetical protein